MGFVLCGIGILCGIEAIRPKDDESTLDSLIRFAVFLFFFTLLWGFGVYGILQTLFGQ